MTSLQILATRSLKERQSSAAPENPEAQPLRTQSTKTRADWLRHFFPSEAQETLMNFANLFASEKEMEERALQLKREGRGISSEVSDWSYVNSKHQNLRSRKAVEEPKPDPAPPKLPERREGEYYQERRGGYRRMRRGRVGRYAQRQWVDRAQQEHHREEAKEPTADLAQLSSPPLDIQPKAAEIVHEPVITALPRVDIPVQELPKQDTAKPEPPKVDSFPKVEPKVEKPVSVTEPEKSEPIRPAPRETRPLSQPKSFGPKKWVKKVPASNPAPPLPSQQSPPSQVHIPTHPQPTPIASLDDPLKEAEAQAQKMTMELVDQSDESIEHSSREVGVQTERRGTSESTQTEAGLIWREGIPCMLVPLAAMEGAKVQLTMLGNPAGLFHS